MNTKAKKKSSENFDILIFIVPAQEFLVHGAVIIIFTVRTTFFVALQKCYRISVSHSNFYVESPNSFWLTFFSI